MKRSLVLVFFLTGCQVISPRQEAVVQEEPLTNAQIRNARRFVVEYGSSGLWQWDSTRWVFEEDGKCFGEATNSREMTNQTIVSKKTFELPSQIFHEAQQTLLQSDILSLKQGLQDFVFESSGSISVECDGRKHSISFGAPTQRCQGLIEFLNSLPDRAKVTSSSANGP
jgi:hypothetical protein